MNDDLRQTLQQRIPSIRPVWFDSLHGSRDVPPGFRPWECGLSPSALYSCSLKCRKAAGIKTPEVKWMSIKRWVTSTPDGIDMPPGVFFSVKRSEKFIPAPNPHFEKTEYVLLMFPYGNVWSQVSAGVPITEAWMWSDPGRSGLTMFERLVRKDVAFPLPGYFRKVYDYMTANPDQIGIHLKRKKARPQD